MYFVWVYFFIGIVFLVNVSIWFNFVVVGIVEILYCIEINIFFFFNIFIVIIESNNNYVFCFFYFKIYFFVIKLKLYFF